MALRPLDHANPAEVGRIHRLLVDSYREEARLLGIADFPPLRRTPEDISAASSTFFGWTREGALVAVAEVEGVESAAPNIAAFAVDPAVFRQGVGSALLRDLLRALGERQVTVSTGEDNLPAVGLYGKHGFVPSSRWRTPDGVRMVTLRRSAG